MPHSLSRLKIRLIWLRGPKIPLKVWVTIIDLWPIVNSITIFQNKSAGPPPLTSSVPCLDFQDIGYTPYHMVTWLSRHESPRYRTRWHNHKISLLYLTLVGRTLECCVLICIASIWFVIKYVLVSKSPYRASIIRPWKLFVYLYNLFQPLLYRGIRTILGTI